MRIGIPLAQHRSPLYFVAAGWHVCLDVLDPFSAEPPTPAMAQSLCFRQVCLAAPQSVLSAVASFNDKCVV
jgi:hypothetical protein